MKCPKCHQTDCFRLSVWQLVTEDVFVSIGGDGVYEVYDEDSTEIEERFLDPGCVVKCGPCGYTGPLKDFDDGNLPYDVQAFGDYPGMPVLIVGVRRCYVGITAMMGVHQITVKRRRKNESRRLSRISAKKPGH